MRLTLSVARGPRFCYLHLTRIAFPTLLQLLHTSRNLVDLWLHDVLNPRHCSSEALTNTLSGMYLAITLWPSCRYSHEDSRATSVWRISQSKNSCIILNSCMDTEWCVRIAATSSVRRDTIVYSEKIPEETSQSRGLGSFINTVTPFPT